MSVIAVAVVVRHGCVLVGRRAENAPEAAGLDEFPGGKVEAGEAPACAAARECLEARIAFWDAIAATFR